jgi:hypothetical protein
MSLLLLAPLPVTVEHNKNRSDVNSSRDAINSKLNRNITDKQQQQGGVLLADASNQQQTYTRIITSRTSNNSRDVKIT